MKIIYTKHALKKFTDLKKQGVSISKKMVKATIENPFHMDDITDAPKYISSASFDNERVLRVVYKKEDDIITVITFYPARKGRYFI